MPLFALLFQDLWCNIDTIICQSLLGPYPYTGPYAGHTMSACTTSWKSCHLMWCLANAVACPVYLCFLFNLPCFCCCWESIKRTERTPLTELINSAVSSWLAWQNCCVNLTRGSFSFTITRWQTNQINYLDLDGHYGKGFFFWGNQNQERKNATMAMARMRMLLLIILLHYAVSFYLFSSFRFLERKNCFL